VRAEIQHWPQLVPCSARHFVEFEPNRVDAVVEIIFKRVCMLIGNVDYTTRACLRNGKACQNNIIIGNFSTDYYTLQIALTTAVDLISYIFKDKHR